MTWERPPAEPPAASPTRPEPIFADSAFENATRPGEREPAGRIGSGRPWQPSQPGSGWTEYPPSGFPGQAWPAGARGPLGAPTEPDELFRAWQGSVNEAAGGRGPWSVTRRAASAARRRRALQAAAIGVPVAVIVTVGAGALMMLTGRANDMLAVRADTSTPSSAATSPAAAGASRGAGGVPPALVNAALSGYPGQRGAVSVASMLTTAGVAVAVGAADGHPAIWRQAANGSWTLESAASLGGLTGSAGLTSIAHGRAGWIAVGAAADGATTEPVVLASADGAHWQPVTALTARAGAGTEFLGVAAGAAGYVVAGRQLARGRTFAVLWYSADLRSWDADDNGGLDGRLQASTANAVAATAGGFIAVGSHGAAQAIWSSPDGRHWQLGSMPAPADATSATLRSVVASGTRVVAGGYAATRAGDIPVVVTTGGGGQWQQTVLQSPDGLGVVTALTTTPDGFTAAGVLGRGSSQLAVTWASPNGQTWSRPVQTAGADITALAVDGAAVVGAAQQGTATTLTTLPARTP